MEAAIAWAMIAFFAFGAMASVSVIGKDREPLTHGLVNAILVVDALFIIGVVYLWRH